MEKEMENAVSCLEETPEFISEVKIAGDVIATIAGCFFILFFRLCIINLPESLL